MKIKRNTLTDELMCCQETEDLPSRKSFTPIVINYNQIIQKQSQIIESLYKQCTALRQKINRLNSESIFSSQYKSLHQNSMEKFAEMIETALLKEIASLLQIPENQITKNKILQSIKRLKWERQKRSEPIFIERKKEVRVPVPVEVIVEKIVQKIIVEQKIIIQEKIVEVPVFRQKIVQKFIPKVQDNNILLAGSQISSKGKQQENQSRTSRNNEFLETKSTIKQKSKQKVEIQNKNIQQNNENQRKLGLGKKLSLNDFRQDQMNSSVTQYSKYENDMTQNKNRGGKNYMKSPRYSNNEYRDNRKYDYANEEDNYTYQRRNQYDYRGGRQDNYYNRIPYVEKMSLTSPRNYQQKYREEEDSYLDKSRVFDSGERYNKKRKDKYHCNDRYKD